MAAHRYWRAQGLQTYGGASLEISELHLYGGLTRLDASATLTASVGPASGALANLYDADTATSALWSAADVPALALTWDFGAGTADVTHVLLGDAGSLARFTLVANLLWSDDGVTWTAQDSFTGLEWPGLRAMQTSYSLAGNWSRTDRGSPSYVPVDASIIETPGAVAARAVLGASSGVRQFELERVDALNDLALYGLGRAAAPVASVIGSTADSWALSSNNGNKITNNTSTAYASATGLSAQGVVIGVVVNFTAGTITFYRNGVSLGVAYTDAAIVGSTLYPMYGRAGVGGVSSARLRMSGFSYPIVGASDWATGYTAPRSMVPGAAVASHVGVVPSLAYTGPGTARETSPIVLVRGDFITGVLGRGVGRVKGTTKDKGSPNVPVREKVRLHRQSDGLVIREDWSAAGTGAYSFDYVDELQAYYVVAFDHDLTFRAVIADNLTLAGGGVELIA